MPDHANDFALHTELAKALPDIPRFIETRGMLLAKRCKVFGQDKGDQASFVVRRNETGLVAVIGKPSREAIRQAVEESEKQGAVLAFDDNFSLVEEALPGWTSARATLHLLSGEPKPIDLPVVNAFAIIQDKFDERHAPINLPFGGVQFLRLDEIEALVGLSAELKAELIIESKFTPILAVIVDEKPVAFCYAGAETETLWDISIDTVEGYRNRGYAALCVTFMINRMNAKGKRPVWGAVESNTASMRLAAKLGFVPVDELFVFEQ